MSLLQKVEDYTQTVQSEDSFSSLGDEIVKDLEGLVASWHKAPSEKTQENISLLWEVYQALPDSFFYNYSQGLLEIIFKIPSLRIYETFSSIDLFDSSSADLNLLPEDYEALTLLMLRKYITKVSKKELVLYVKTFAQGKVKNLQLRFVLIEILNYSIVHITKKEVFLSDILPTIFKLLYESLSKFNKYKGRINNQEYVEAPEPLIDYTNNYETWIWQVFSKIMKTGSKVIDENKSKEFNQSILMISDLYEAQTRTYIEDKTVDKSLLIAHFYVILYLELIWLILEHGKTMFSEDTYAKIMNTLLENLLTVCPTSTGLLKNYINQVKLINEDSSVIEYNKGDPYDRRTMYNSVAMMYIAIQLCQSSEGAILSSEFKLSSLLICLNRFFICPSRNEELKRDGLSAILVLLTSLELHNPPGYINNLNRFDITLDKILERILDYAGGPVDPKDKAVGLEIFSKIKKLLSEKTTCDLFLSTIGNTKNLALSGFLIIEFKGGLTTTLRGCGGGQEIKDSPSAFLNINNLDKFFRLIKNVKLNNPMEEYEIIGACVNVLLLVYMKYSFLVKNVPEYMRLEFKEYCNIFRPGNLGILLRYGEKLMNLQNMIRDDVDLQKKNMADLQQSNPNDQALAMNQMKFYELIMMFDSITRIEEIYKELKSFCPK